MQTAAARGRCRAGEFAIAGRRRLSSGRRGDRDLAHHLEPRALSDPSRRVLRPCAHRLTGCTVPTAGLPNNW
jgi:hypothetical protein